MPIRHCQKCGLRVLIDDSQSTQNPFFCLRCTSVTVPAYPEPAAELAPAAPAPKGPIKVVCPYCKASFNGKIPVRPAKGACPVCRKELILLPDGKIRSAAGFDPAEWQREQSRQPSVQERPHEPDPVLSQESPVSPEPQPATGDIDASLAAALGMEEAGDAVSLPATEPEPASDPLGEPESPEPSPEPIEEAPPKPSRSPSTRVLNARPIPSAIDPTETPPRKSTTVAPRTPVRLRGTDTALKPVVSTGRGRNVAAVLLFLLPLISAVVIFTMKDGSMKGLLDKLGARASEGLRKIHRMISSAPAAPAPLPVAAPPPKEPPPPPPEESPEEAAAKNAQLKEQIIGLWMKHRKLERDIAGLSVGATEAQKEELKKAEENDRALLETYRSLQEEYRRRTGSEVPEDQ